MQVRTNRARRLMMVFIVLCLTFTVAASKPKEKRKGTRGAVEVVNPPADIPPEYRLYDVTIVSDPPGAEIEIGYVRCGRTPVTIKLQPGPYATTLSLPGLKVWEHMILVPASRGELKVNLNEAAQVAASQSLKRSLPVEYFGRPSGATGGVSNSDIVHVRSYDRADGTHVNNHDRTRANNTDLDNWSTRGNVNPETGKVGTRTPNN